MQTSDSTQLTQITCPWLQQSPRKCNLLQTLTGLTQDDQCQVNQDACAACVKWFMPTEEYLNPVVASLLYTISSGVSRSGGAPGCTAERAHELCEFALESIPDDLDAVPVSQQVNEQQNSEIDDIADILPRPHQRHGPPVRQWAVAVTTAPRQQSTLDSCLESILAAGWSTPRIIVDGEVTVDAKWSHLPVTKRVPQIGAWPSYYLALIELMMRQPSADVYMIVQDDVVLFKHRKLRSYLETALWPGRPGIASLFCSRAYAQATPGWHALDTNLVWGGQALLFARDVAISLVSDPGIVGHRFNGQRGLANIDGLIGGWAFETDTPVYVTAPSLSQHIGHVSSLWKSSRAFVNRSAASFAGTYTSKKKH